MKKIYSYIILLLVSFCWVSCNNEWEDEQFKQLVSFKATINGEGVSSTYVRYKPNGKMNSTSSMYRLRPPLVLMA